MRYFHNIYCILLCQVKHYIDENPFSHYNNARFLDNANKGGVPIPLLYNQYLTKREYLARVGEIGQSFGIRCMEYAAGKAAFTRAYDVDTAGGLRFSVNESKGLDLFSFTYRGISFPFITKAALTSPWLADEQGMAYRGCLGAGFLYTAGLSNVGGPCEDGGFYHYAHGNLKNIPAENVCWETRWQGDECLLRICGDVRDAAFFGRNLLLHRQITANVGEKRLFLEDEIENQGFAPEQVMLLYHMNLGWPVLDEGTQLIAPVESAEPLSAHTSAHDANYAHMIAPLDENEEYLYALRLKRDSAGMTACCAYNSRLRLGLYVRYNADPLRYLIEWKCMCSGDYALGMLPSTCKPVGRIADRSSGESRVLAPFETLKLRLEIGVIDGDAELDDFRKSLSAMK